MLRGPTGHYVRLPSAGGEKARAFVPNPLPPDPSLDLQTELQELVSQAPALAIYPGLLIFITVIAVNFLGDGMQHAFDPRSERR